MLRDTIFIHSDAYWNFIINIKCIHLAKEKEKEKKSNTSPTHNNFKTSMASELSKYGNMWLRE